MSHALARLGRSLSHHWKRSIAVALLAFVLLGALASAGGEAPDDFNVPGTESQEALDLFRAHTPAFAGADSTLVFNVEQGTLEDAEAREAVTSTLAEVGELEGVAEVGDPYAEGFTQISEDRTIAAVDVRYTTEPGDLDKDEAELLIETAEGAEPAVNVEARGIIADLASEQEAPVGELVGVLIAIVLLTLLFRSGAATAATLIGALFGVFISQIILAVLAAPLDHPSFAAFIAMMLGLGAGIDYSLLIIGRYREQRHAGDSVRDGAAKALATSGATVVAAGLIVMVAIAGLLVIGIPFMGKMGLGAAIAVAAVVVSALTILPIMMGMFGRRLVPKKPEHVAVSARFERWGERITARPWLAIAAGVGILLVFAIPVTQMRLGLPDDGNQPESRTQRAAYDLMTDAFGPGSNGPFLLAVDTSGGADEGQLTQLADAVRETEGIESVAPPLPSEDGEMATIFAIPTTAPQDEATSDLLDRLRSEVIPGAVAGTPLKVYVGGNTASFEDLSAKVQRRLPLFIGVVIGLSMLLLMMAFRSVWIPLVSALLNLLSIGAAYGVVTAVFQEGIGASLIGADSGVPIMSFVPVMLFAILFGLSMDYNVFLLSRVHEAFDEGDGPRASVVHGLARIGKTILFAGLIMAAVFLAFVTQPDIIGKMMGLGLGMAILIDVLLVRLVVAPAVVTLLGDKAWWMPAWLDRVLPNVSLEGHLVDAVDEREDEREKVPA